MIKCPCFLAPYQAQIQVLVLPYKFAVFAGLGSVVAMVASDTNSLKADLQACYTRSTGLVQELQQELLEDDGLSLDPSQLAQTSSGS